MCVVFVWEATRRWAECEKRNILEEDNKRMCQIRGGNHVTRGWSAQKKEYLVIFSFQSGGFSGYAVAVIG